MYYLCPEVNRIGSVQTKMNKRQIANAVSKYLHLFWMK